MSTAPRERAATPAGRPGRWSGDATTLAGALRREVDGDIHFDGGTRAMYATTGSNYRQVPIGVVVPRTTEAFAAGLEVCRRFRAPIVSRGGGTSLAGQICNTAVVFDASRYLRRIKWLDPDRRLAAVEPGVVLDDLRRAAGAHGLTFGPDPSTHGWCTLGGMIGNNSCGVHSVTAGRTSDNVESLDVVTGDGVRLTVGPTGDEAFAALARSGGRTGEIYGALAALRDRHAAAIRQTYPPIPRRVSGYGLDQLLPENGGHVARALVGTEGTCVTVLGAVVRLVPDPPERVLLVLGFDDIFRAADRVPEVLEGKPLGLEGIDERLADAVREHDRHQSALRLLPGGHGWLLAEFGGDTREQAADAARAVVERLRAGDAPATRLLEDAADQQAVWRVREEALGVTARPGSDRPSWPGWEDAAVAPAALGRYLRAFDALLTRHDLQGALYGHFGDGCVHTRIDFDFTTEAGRQQFRHFVADAAALVVEHGGSLSGEHGDGQARSEFLPLMFGDEVVRAFREFKSIWDPAWRLNPGRKVDPDPIDTHLRLGPDYQPARPATHFAFEKDGGEFQRATLRCVGVSACRDTHGGTMCPSYRATREERHSTRGRARLLFEMLRGDALDGGWKNEAVRDALDLCLACKACKSECPVQVDMATYKAEFLSHYYEGRLRPRQAYTLGWIRHWARLAAMLPWTARQVTTLPGARSIARAVAGVSSSRRLPQFARRTFREVHDRRPGATGRPRVVLWTDTFTNYLLPHTAEAAASVLAEAGGFDVVLPPAGLCCGRPLYDYGRLDEARRTLAEVLDGLRAEIDAGTPVVFLEPSCASVFRDELPNLFPGNEAARRLAAATRDFGEFLDERADRFEWPTLGGAAIVQGHCHQQSLGSLDPDVRVLGRLGVDAQLLDAGCCGMAGAFGFEAEHYEVSKQVGEERLLPAVRGAAASTFVVANGFSCREQIRQETPRRALHLADVCRLALDGMPAPQPFAESRYLDAAERREAAVVPRPAEAALLGAGAVALTAAAWLFSRSSRRH